MSLKSLLRKITLPKSVQAAGGGREAKERPPLWDLPNVQIAVWDP